MKKLALIILIFTSILGCSGCGAAAKNQLPAQQEIAPKAQESVPTAQENTPTTQENNSTTQEISPTAPENTPKSKENLAPKLPHSYGDFKGANQAFSGGGPVENYNLAGIRRVPHPSFYRMVFEFSVGENSTERAAAVPAYQITMNNDQTQITMDLPGVNWAAALKNKEAIINAAPLLKNIQFQSKTQGGGQILLTLQQKAVFQVFDLTNPSRVVIVMNPMI